MQETKTERAIRSPEENILEKENIMNHYQNKYGNFIFALLCILLLNAAPAMAGNEIVPGELDIDPPTLIGLGFEWWVEGDDNNNASLVVDFRKPGQTDWLPALEPMYFESKNINLYNAKGKWSVSVDKHFAGSVIDLEEDTAYEVRLTLNDPDGVSGEAEKIFQTRTRKVPVAYESARQIEVKADGNGAGLEEALKALQPGDTILLHAGTYSPPAFAFKDSPASTNGPKVQTPQGGELRHVYPPGYKGKKEEPNYTTIMHAYHGARWEYDIQYLFTDVGVQPGDTVLVHGGVYATQPTNYRSLMSLWQHGSYRFTRKGTSEKPIIIKAAGDGPVILDGAGAYRMFDFLGSAYNVVEGLTLRNAFIGIDVAEKEKGLKAEGLVIQDCNIEDVRQALHGADDTDVRLINTTIKEGASPDRSEGRYVIASKGTKEKPITIKPFGDGEVIIDGRNNTLLFDVMASDHLIIEGLTMRNTFTAVNGGRRGVIQGSKGLTIKNCRMENIQNGVWGQDGKCRDFTILDNVFIGRAEEDGRGGYAVVLNGAGHAVGYNYSYAFWDHLNVSTSATPIEGNRAWSMDFYNNICVRGIDNMFEVDGTMWNTRFMRNLCSYSNSFAFSSQQTNLGPSYYIRNILYEGRGSTFKFLRSPGAHAYHNTIVWAKEGRSGNAANNLVLESLKDADPAIFTKVSKPVSDKYPMRGTPPVDVTDLDFSLTEGAKAIDEGKIVRGLNEDFAGDAPDLGALEAGKPVPHYGPRTQKINK